MCMTAICQLGAPEARGTGWKVFYLGMGRLKAAMCFTREEHPLGYTPGEWYNAATTGRSLPSLGLDACGVTKEHGLGWNGWTAPVLTYPMGFHVYLRREDCAKRVQGSPELVLRKVDWESQLALGMGDGAGNYSAPAVVAARMRIVAGQEDLGD